MAHEGDLKIYAFDKSGDIGYEYNPYKVSNFKVVAITMASGLLIMGIGKLFQEYENQYLLLLLAIPIALMLYNLWDMFNLRKNTKIENKAINSCFALKVVLDKIKEKYGEDVTINKIRFSLRMISLFGKNKRVVYVLLSNNTLLEYHVIQRKQGDDKKWRLTLKNNFSECKSDDIVTSMLSTKEKVKLMAENDDPRLGLLLYFIFWVVMITIMSYVAFKYPFMAVIGLWIYLLVIYLIIWLSKHTKIHEKLITCLLIPQRMLNLAITLSAPFLVLVFGIIVIVVIGGIASLFVYLLAIYMIKSAIIWNLSLAVFIGLSCTSIIAVHFNKVLMYAFEKSGILTYTERKDLEMPLLGMAQYFFQKQNINFFVYLCYFILLVISIPNDFLSEGGFLVLNNQDVGGAISKALLLHIAATNMFAKYSDTNITSFNIYKFIKRILGRER